MNIYIGTVITNSDITKAGTLTVLIPDLGKDPLEVILASPFYTLNGGGFLGIPENGSRILVAKEDDSADIYYLSTIISNEKNDSSGKLLEWNVIGDKYVYSERNKPQKVLYTDQLNSGLKISRRILPTYITAKVDLDSEKGKRISLNDSPKSDMVLIRNEHGDGIVISSKPNDVHSDRSIEVKSKGAQRHVVFQSNMEFSVIEGRDITIENKSSGINAGRDTEGRYGNINIKSENSDLNLICDKDDGRIFLITPKSRIQIESDGSIIIDSKADIKIQTTENLDIKANKNINIDGQTLNIKTQNDCVIDCNGSFSAKSGGTNSLDGAAVYLNSNVSKTGQPVEFKQPETTDYGE